MKEIKKFITVGAMVLIVGASSATAFAASNYSSPAEALARLTGTTVEKIVAEKAEIGKTYGAMANDAGKLAEYQSYVLQIKKDALAEKVAAGVITQERADEIISSLETRQANCDGTGTSRDSQRLGAGFGKMQGNGQGNRGFGQCNGNCQAQ